MARLNRFGFVVIAVVFHLVYIYSIFDIYFVSPIVHGMKAFSTVRRDGDEAPAQRLVLFVGDGLRADKAFQSFPDPSPADPNASDVLQPRPLMPFLRSKVEHEGTFGVSHTRVPTESRPGHVALIAGLYEDVSAVTTGWKLNPVDFDSVFNRSKHTWSWGSPDILPMFKEGAVPGRVDAETYATEDEDYTQDATALDTWVFDKVEELFKTAADDKVLGNALRQDKIVLFLHLLGLDTTGHAYRPYSKEYLHNIKIVDQGVERIAKLIEKFYGDGKTAYVFTADHGMSDWGSHGDGHPDNTRTPLVAWGSGVKKPRIRTNKTAAGHDDGFSWDWGLDHIARYDVEQADVAALMAYLVGLEFPVNSVGKLPLPYLAAGIEEQATAALVNAEAVLEMYRVKEEQKRTTELRYRPFAAFHDQEHSVSERAAHVRSIIDEEDYELAIYLSHELFQLGLDGLRYLQTYDWLFLRALITIGYLGWIAFAITTVIDLHVLHQKTEGTRSPLTVAVFGAALIALYSSLWIQKSPFTYYLYVFFPVIFWEEVIARRDVFVASKKQLLGHLQTRKDLVVAGVQALATIGLLEALVLSYFYREVYTVCFLAAISWPFFYGPEFYAQNKILIATWGVACVLMSVFTLLPAVKVESSTLISIGGFLMAGLGSLYLLFEQSFTPISLLESRHSATQSADGIPRALLGLQVGLVVLAMIVTRSSVASLQAKSGLPIGNQVVGWAVLVTSLFLPFLNGLQPNNNYLHRLVVIFLTFSPAFVILTISYEGLFYFAFCITLVTWVRLEHRIFASNHSNVPSNKLPTDIPSTPVTLQLSDGKDRHAYRALTLSDTRTAVFFFFLLQSAFFSTGNIASVSSFSLDSVYRLIPVFDPFSQAALLVLKLMIPFAVISANLGILNRRLNVAPSSLFMVVMAISDVLTLNFFWFVRDEGSWLDIGTSISHFAISSLLCVFVSLLELLSEVFVSGVEVGDGRPLGQGKKTNGVAADRHLEPMKGGLEGNGTILAPAEGNE